MTLRLDADRYQWLREQSYLHHISMQSIVEEAIDLLRRTGWTAEKTEGQTQ